MAPRGYNIPTNFTPTLDFVAEQEGLDPDTFERMIQAESNFNPSAVSPAGAMGLGQLMPGTAADLGVDPFDPVENLFGSARYMKQQVDKFGEYAPVAYNWGPGNAQKWIEKGADIDALPDETEGYLAKVGGASLGVPDFSPARYTDSEISNARTPTYSPRREQDLSRVAAEISGLEQTKQEALEGLKSQGQLDENEAIAIALTAILPTLLGFGFGGGLQGAAVGAQAGAAGANAGIQGLTAQMNRRDQVNTTLLNDARQRLAQKEGERQNISNAMANAEELGERAAFNTDAIADRVGKRGKIDEPITQEQADVIGKLRRREELTSEDYMVLGTINPYKLNILTYGTGANMKPADQATREKIEAGSNLLTELQNLRGYAKEYTPGFKAWAESGGTGLYKNMEAPATKYEAAIESVVSLLAMARNKGALTEQDVKRFIPMIKGSVFWDTDKSQDERLDLLEKMVKDALSTTMSVSKSAGANMAGFESDPSQRSQEGEEQLGQATIKGPNGATLRLKEVRKK